MPSGVNAFLYYPDDFEQLRKELPLRRPAAGLRVPDLTSGAGSRQFVEHSHPHGQMIDEDDPAELLISMAPDWPQK